MRQKKPGRARRGGRKSLPTRSLELVIDTLGAQGDGLASVDGERFYVPRTVPGDRIRADVSGNKAKSFELLEAGPSRIKPGCPHYDECGGCALQHIEEDQYREHKLSQMTDTLAKAGLVFQPIETLWGRPHSRRRVTLRARGRKETALLGFQVQGSHKLTNIETCLVMTPELVAALPVIRGVAHEILAPGEEAGFALTEHSNGIELAIDLDTELYEEKRLTVLQLLGEAANRLAFTCITVNQEPALRVRESLESFEGHSVSVPPGAFLQPSHEGEVILINEVLKHQPEANHGRALDLYSGCGTFALPLSSSFEVIAYEGVPEQVKALEEAARKNQIKALSAIRRDLFKEPLGDLELRKIDYAVLNPPRAGAKDQAIELAKSDVARITYVSCNPGTLARDGAELLKGGYKLTSLLLLDQFVFSAHSECVAVFDKR